MRDAPLRDHLLALLRGGDAHVDFETAVSGLPPNLRGAKPPGQPFTPWRLVEHLRIAQWDILEFIRNPHHVSPPFPAGYWPERDAPPDAAAWEASVEAYRTNQEAMEHLVMDASIDLLAPLAHGDGKTALREVLVAADHASYHIGQLVLVRRALGAWSD